MGLFHLVAMRDEHIADCDQFVAHSTTNRSSSLGGDGVQLLDRHHCGNHRSLGGNWLFQTSAIRDSGDSSRSLFVGIGFTNMAESSTKNDVPLMDVAAAGMGSRDRRNDRVVSL